MIWCDRLWVGFWCDVSSRTCLAGLNVLLHKAKYILFYSRVLRVLWVVWVGVGSRVALVMGRGGVKAASPVCWLLPSREKFPILIYFLSSLMCRPWGIRLKGKIDFVGTQVAAHWISCIATACKWIFKPLCDWLNKRHFSRAVSSDFSKSLRIGSQIPPDCWQINCHRPASMVQKVYRRTLVHTDYAQNFAVFWHVINQPLGQRK